MGQLATNERTTRSSPVQIPGVTWRSVSGDWETIIASKTDGTLWTWGKDKHGAGGVNEDNTNHSSPVQIGSDTTWSTLHSSAYSISVSTKTDGTLWTWGSNDNGSLGLNNRTQYSSPIQVPGTTWSSSGSHKVTTHHNNGMTAIKTDGTLWVWGKNTNGVLGINSPVNTRYSSPVQIPGTTWRTVHAYGSHATFATKTDGTAWAWGFNTTVGQLGINDRTSRSSPTQIPGTNWELIISKHYGAYAKKTDGTLWAWGINTYGALGQNAPESGHRSSPVQIPGTTWRTLGEIRDGAIATKTDGTLWLWGNNYYGSLGQNNRTEYSSPVQVGSDTDWSANQYSINGGEYWMHIVKQA